jgi:DNA-binding FadR family transcriptional regulator
MGDTSGPVGQGLHGQVLERLGVAICGGDLAPGGVITLEEIEARYGVSRTVARESVRVLSSMGLVSSRRRVGVQVLPASEWNLYAPQVIRWRLASSARMDQIRALIELRLAIEPEAARLAAERSTPSAASELMGLAGKLWAAGQGDDVEEFLKYDIEFHGLVLSSSGNLMFGKLDSLVGETLRGRTSFGLVPDHPHADSLQLHIDVAGSIQRGDGELAREAMRKIMLRTVQEMETAKRAHAFSQEPPTS